MKNIQDIPGIIHTYTELLERFELPRSAVAPISELGALMKDGMRCSDGWQNGRGCGRPAKQGLQHQVPWTNGVHCQRFFKGRHASGWFKVTAAAGGQQAEETDEQRVERIAAQQALRFE